MQDMMNFVLWFMEEFPAILLTPPISAFTGLLLLGWTSRLFGRLCQFDYFASFM